MWGGFGHSIAYVIPKTGLSSFTLSWFLFLKLLSQFWSDHLKNTFLFICDWWCLCTTIPFLILPRPAHCKWLLLPPWHTSSLLRPEKSSFTWVGHNFTPTNGYSDRGFNYRALNENILVNQKNSHTFNLFELPVCEKGARKSLLCGTNTDVVWNGKWIHAQKRRIVDWWLSYIYVQCTYCWWGTRAPWW